MQLLQSLLFILFSVCLLLSLLLYVFQSSFVYLPMLSLYATPADTGLEYEDVWLTTDDGVRIHGWFLPHPSARATLLFLHGNGGNLSHRLEKLALFRALGLQVFIIDYRGYGQSEGTPSEQGTYLDASAAWRYLTTEKKIPAEKIILYGESLGGAVAAWLGSRHRAGGLITESAFTSIADMARHYYPYLPVRLLTRIHYPVIKYITGVHFPVLIIHSPDDEIVPFAQAQALYQAANEPKTFLEISGDHNSGFLHSIERYRNGLDKFISTCFAGR